MEDLVSRAWREETPLATNFLVACWCKELMEARDLLFAVEVRKENERRKEINGQMAAATSYTPAH